MSVTAQTCVVLLTGKGCHKHHPNLVVTRHQRGISALVFLTPFRGETSGVVKCRLPSIRLISSARYWDFFYRNEIPYYYFLHRDANCFTFLGYFAAFTFMTSTIPSRLIQFSTTCCSLSRRVRTQTSSESSISAFKACSCWGSLKVHSRQCYRCFRKQVPITPFSAIDVRRVLLYNTSRINHQ